MTNFIPSNNAEFDGWQENLVTIATHNATAWNIPSNTLTAVAGAQETYSTAYKKVKVKGTASQADRQGYTDARDNYEGVLRDMIRECLANNPAISNQNRIAMGIPVRDTSSTPRPAISVQPVVVLTPQQGARIKVTTRTSPDAGRAAMLRDADAVELRYAMTTTALGKPEDCPHSLVSSKAIFTISAEGSDAGKRLYCFARYINNSDPKKNGQWTAIESAVITD